MIADLEEMDREAPITLLITYTCDASEPVIYKTRVTISAKKAPLLA